MGKSWSKIAQFFHKMTAAIYRNAVYGVLSREYGARRNGAKLLAQDADVCTRTARNWMDGVCAPRGEELVRLMRENDRLRAEIFALTDRGRECPKE